MSDADAPDFDRMANDRAILNEAREDRKELARLQELLRGTEANRYWEGRWRDADAEIARLRTDNERLGNIINTAGDDYDRLRRVNEGLVAEMQRVIDHDPKVQGLSFGGDWPLLVESIMATARAALRSATEKGEPT